MAPFFAPLEAGFRAAGGERPDLIVEEHEPWYMEAEGTRGPQLHFEITHGEFSQVYVFANSTLPDQALPTLIAQYPSPPSSYPHPDRVIRFNGFGYVRIEDDTGELHSDVEIRFDRESGLTTYECDDGSATPEIDMLASAGPVDITVLRPGLFRDRVLATGSVVVHSGQRHSFILRNGKLVERE